MSILVVSVLQPAITQCRSPPHSAAPRTLSVSPPAAGWRRGGPCCPAPTQHTGKMNNISYQLKLSLHVTQPCPRQQHSSECCDLFTVVLPPISVFTAGARTQTQQSILPGQLRPPPPHIITCSHRAQEASLLLTLSVTPSRTH